MVVVANARTYVSLNIHLIIVITYKLAMKIVLLHLAISSTPNPVAGLGTEERRRGSKMRGTIERIRKEKEERNLLPPQLDSTFSSVLLGSRTNILQHIYLAVQVCNIDKYAQCAHQFVRSQFLFQ